MIALGLSLVTAPALADVLVMPEGDARPEASLPAKGSTMTVVEKKYGAPRNKRPSVGGDTPKHPPITRWDYDGFYVVFEHDKVVDAVVPGAPPRIYNKDQLRPATASAAPAMPPPVVEPVVPPVELEPITEEPQEAPAEAAAVTAPAETPPAEAPAIAAPGTYPDAPAPSTPPPATTPNDAPPTPK